MEYETKRYITKVLYERAVYAQEYNQQWSHTQWNIYRDFKNHLRRYDRMKWLVKKLPVLTFGIGMILGIMLGRLT